MEPDNLIFRAVFTVEREARMFWEVLLPTTRLMGRPCSLVSFGSETNPKGKVEIDRLTTSEIKRLKDIYNPFIRATNFSSYLDCARTRG